MAKSVKRIAYSLVAILVPVTSSGCRTQATNHEVKADLTDNLARPKLLLPAPQTPYKAVDNLLHVYDGCKQKWIATDLPYRDIPTFPTTELSKEPHADGYAYESAGQKFRLYEVDGRNLNLST